jgi:hypothetical protein
MIAQQILELKKNMRAGPPKLWNSSSNYHTKNELETYLPLSRYDKRGKPSVTKRMLTDLDAQLDAENASGQPSFLILRPTAKMLARKLSAVQWTAVCLIPLYLTICA